MVLKQPQSDCGLTPYGAVLAWILKQRRASDAGRMTKLVLALSQGDMAHAYSECGQWVSPEQNDLAADVIAHYLRVGDNLELSDVVAKLLARFPREAQLHSEALLEQRRWRAALEPEEPGSMPFPEPWQIGVILDRSG